MACSALYSEECCGSPTNTAVTPLDARWTDLTVMFTRTTILRDAFFISAWLFNLRARTRPPN